MNSTSRSLFVALALTSGLASCGSKAKITEVTAEAPAVASAEAPAAATTAPASPEPAASTQPAGTFDLSTVPVSEANLGQFPYLTVLKDYSVNTSNSVSYDFERSYLYDGKNIIAVEGKVARQLISPDNSDKKASQLMIQRNYADLLKSLGAVQVSTGNTPQAAVDKIGEDEFRKHMKWAADPSDETDTYVIRQKDKEVWVQVTPLSDGNYALNVTERAAMPQQAGLMKADELKKN